MGLIKYQNQFPSLFDNFFDNDYRTLNRTNSTTTNTVLPSVNIKENVDAYTVEVAAPGFVKSDFNIEVDNDVLTIYSDKIMEQNDGEKIQFKSFLINPLNDRLLYLN